ncbi:MAG: circularly permuted type 2 ATP-grasp protein [Geminicoccaceae bacterium]
MLRLSIGSDPDPVAALLAGYAAGHGHDELIDGDGGLRLVWRGFVDHWCRLNPNAIENMAATLDRLLAENDVLNDPHATDQDGSDRQVDLFPQMITAERWVALEQGLIQRAQLIEAVLGDVYGRARLLHERILPSSLVFGHPRYLAACRGWSNPPRRYLWLYACDVAIDDRGRFRVLADHTEAPSGKGDLLGIRVALGQALGDLYLDQPVQRHAGFYSSLQEALAGGSKGDGRSVILSPGNEDRNFSSHAYIARYLGFTLAGHGDLTARDGIAYLKTLEGLQRIDMLLRKVDSLGADPLSLPAPGTIGTAGLVDAARAGNLLMANAFGSGVATGRTLAPFMATLAQRIRGEDLLLLDAPCLWLGDPDQRRRYLDEPERWTLLRSDQAGVVHAPIDPKQTINLLAREGYRWLARRKVALATTPRWHDGKILPASTVIRLHVGATADGYVVLPGGWARHVSGRAADHWPERGRTADLWVAAEESDRRRPQPVAGSIETVFLRRTGRDLLSSTADNLFWLGRYTARAEATVRVTRAVLRRLLEETRSDRDPLFLNRLLALQLDGESDQEPPDTGPLARLERTLADLLVGPDQDQGLQQTFGHVRRTARLCRGQLSQEAWRVLEQLTTDRRWRSLPGPLVNHPPLHVLDDALVALGAFAGSVVHNMTRNFAWRFMELGRRIELGGRTARWAAGTLVDDDELAQPSLAAALELGDSTMTFRSRYMVAPLATPVIDLLVLDETNPRSLAFQLMMIERLLDEIGGESAVRALEHRQAIGLLTAFRLVDASQVSVLGEDRRRTHLAMLAERTVSDLAAMSDAIATSYFAHADTPVDMAMMRGQLDG